jgi:hypothetical protein
MLKRGCLNALLVAGTAAGASFLPACGGGGGGGSSNAPGDTSGSVITLAGPPGRLSRTIQEANQDNGATPPPSLPPTVSTDNHWIRLEFPFPIDASTILENSTQTSAFSYLNGNITITDPKGEHVPGMALVNGVDVFGVNHAADTGFPHDVQNGVDLNLGPNVFLYVADTDRNLSTIAAFGYKAGANNARDEIKNVAFHINGFLDTVRVTCAAVNGASFNAVWTFHIGLTNDTRPPHVLHVLSEINDPTAPLNDSTADVHSSFIVEFSEPVVPKSVGVSAALNGTPYNGNLPLMPIQPPLPNTALSTTVTTAIGTVFIPFDCNPLNINNLATYRLTPLIDLPPKVSVDLVVRAITANTNATTLVGDSPMDLAGNHYDGEDADSNGVPDGTDLTVPFTTGPGPALVNVPVSPEVVYWAPASGNGIGAIDLNGWGLTTNKPGANAGNRNLAPIITKSWIDGAGCEANPGGSNLASGIGLWASPGGSATPLDPCTALPMLEFGHNRYWWPVGTGSYPYGPVANKTNGENFWFAPNDPGNPGTPFPGVNEGSSGLETLCRDSSGDVILTGRDFGSVGVVNDMIVGDFLDVVYFDSSSPKTNTSLHNSFFNGGTTGRGNSIADPPTPNPPPLRFWVGLPTIGVVIDQADPTAPPLLLEGDEVFCGFRYQTTGFQQLRPNPVNPNSFDQTIFPHFASGPGGQSATQIFTFSSRQQIGNFLYATDATTKEVHAINSNTMRVISSFSTPDPTGLAIAPDMSRIYVTNFGFDSVSVIGSDPLSPSFHQEIARIEVGAGPKSICVQPDNEDVLVCNFNGNSISFISVGSLTVRKTMDALISQPWDVAATPRQIDLNTPTPTGPQTFGWGCDVWFAYISNFGSNSVAVYESGPDGPQGFGIDNIRGTLPTSDQVAFLIEPKGLCASPLANPSGLLAGGCFVAHRDENGFGRVSHCQFTQQALFGPLPIVAPPGFFIPPGFTDRQFEITATWGNTDSNRLAGSRPVDVALADMNVTAYQSRPSTAPNLGATASVPPHVEVTGRVNSKHPIRVASPVSFSAITPDRVYVSFDDTSAIQSLDCLSTIGTIINTIPAEPSVSGMKRLMGYWKQ